MSEDHGYCMPVFILEDVQIGPANAGCLYLDLDLFRTNMRFVDIL